MNTTIRERIGQTLGLQIEAVKPVSGGDINDAFRIVTPMADFFAKTNTAQFPEMFAKEVAGLELLRDSGAVDVPTANHCGEVDGYQYLVLEWIESARPAHDYWERLGSGLAELHRTKETKFGLNQHNYIGSLVQENAWVATWPEFFGQQRLQPQLRLGLRAGVLPKSLVKSSDALLSKLGRLLPERPEASLLHGDLWGGNVMVGSSGEPIVIDPAVYYGHREMELAFTHLFGGFPSSFYAAYDHAWPIDSGFAERRDLYNLYPLLVHANLFGGHYVNRVASVIGRFV